MQVKLRQVGNSIGLTIPNSELKLMDAKVGDVVEIEIKRVIRHVRTNWDNAELWPGADKESLLLDGLPASESDKDWQW
jgi:antitoxin component of MazEF toxin-antitoxin module